MNPQVKQQASLAVSPLDNDLLVTLLASSREAVIITDEKNRIIEANPAFEKLTDFSRSDLLGKDPRFFASGAYGRGVYTEALSQLEQGNPWEGKITLRKKGGELFPFVLSIQRSAHQGALFNLCFFRTQSDLSSTWDEVYEMAYYDQLTGLSNRAFFIEQLSQALHLCQRTGKKLALLRLDIDHFQKINDSLDYQVGDQVLAQISQILKRVLRKSDLIGRVGSDEFVLGLFNIEKPKYAAEVAEKILAEFRHPIQLENQTVYVGVSLGVSLYPEDGEKAEDLFKASSQALAYVKKTDRGHFYFHAPGQTQKAMDQIFLEGDLRKALKNEELSYVYQPQVDSQSGEILGFEALIRWHHPSRGAVSPVEFIPLAEESDLIIEIGAYTLSRVVTQVKAWQVAGYKKVPVSVNISSKQFSHPEFLDTIQFVLAHCGLEPQYLKLEITEGSLMGQIDQAIETLHRLKALGLSTSIDDFGTGYSSLSYLQRLPIQELKIDRSFIIDICKNHNIANAVINLAKSMNLKVVAEGVEEKCQSDRLKALDCTCIQGFFFSRPLSVGDMAQYLQRPVNRG